MSGTVQATKPPYVVMRCVVCQAEYKIGPSPAGSEHGHPYCEKDFMPLYTVRAVAR